MGLAQERSEDLAFAEDIRLIIWDLDETFWDGTLTEGGIRYRKDHHQLVIDLAKRGIMSAICSKNDLTEIKDLLRGKNLWDYFIYPSIDWTPKGPRIATMLDQIGLRAPSVLFLDDNPMNLAQAAHVNPGLNVGLPSLISSLSDAPQLQGKLDPALSRLAQYKVKERKSAAAHVVGGDTIAFLRQSNVRVIVEHDIEAHIDRAVELINRTNQLNFTKQRLPEDPDTARAALSALLALNTTDAGLIRVRDDYGDYGFVGFYLTERLHNVRRIKHFCFSCRTLNMYIEHWAYGFLGRPPMKVQGEVLSDVQNSTLNVDWITPVSAHEREDGGTVVRQRFDRIVARGGCDLASLMHYFALHSDSIIEEFNHPKNGQMLRRDHSAFLMPAITEPLNVAQLQAATSIGYEAQDFQSALQGSAAGSSLYFLSFWADADIPVYRHRATDLLVPYWLVGAQHHDLISKAELRDAVAQTDQQRARLEVLGREFEHDGLLDHAEMVRRYDIVLKTLPSDAPVVMVLANERGPFHYQDPAKPDHPHHKRLNTALREVCEGHQNVILINPADHIQGADDMIDLNHFKRPIYYKMYRDVLAQLATRFPNKRGKGDHGQP